METAKRLASIGEARLATSAKKQKKASTVATTNATYNLLVPIPALIAPGRRHWMRIRRERRPSKSIADIAKHRESKLLDLTSCIVNKVVNVLSNNLNLTPSEIAVLSCGFSFIPPPNHKRKWSTAIMQNYAVFERNVRIKHFFKNETILYSFMEVSNSYLRLITHALYRLKHQLL